MHNLLKRQFKKYFGDSLQVPKEWQKFIEVVNDAYMQSDVDRGRLERSLDLSSQELLHANSEMRALISLLSATIESTADGILVVNRESKIVIFNQKFVEMWHFPQQILESRNDERALSFVIDQLKDPKVFLKKVRELYANPEAESYDELLFKDGRIFERYSKPQRIGQAITGRVWSFRDITERKIAEEAIIQSETRYRNLFENAHDMIQSVNQDGHFIFVNPSWIETMGYTWDVLSKISIYDILHPSCMPHCMEVFKKVMSGESMDGIEAIFVAKDGRSISVEGNVTPRLMGDQIVGSQGIFRDITDRKRAEEEKEKLQSQFLQAQKMEAVGQLAGGISHDFNNILTAIMGYGHLLQIKLKENDTLRTYADHILSLSDRAANLTQSLLAFSRKQIINPRPVNLNQVVKLVEQLLSRIIGEDIKSRTVLAEKDLIVMADHTQIEQVLMNLATNARDAMPAGGLLTIETETVDIDQGFIKEHGYGKEGSYAVISVTDSGTGMDRETREKIFEPFFTTKEVGKGTGLGLSTVYGIIKQHDGYINIYSEPGRGTTFKIYLPIIEAKVDEIKPEVIKPLEICTETILLAEDETAVREFTMKLLEKYGYKVIDAVDGEDAIGKFKLHKDKIQLVMLDVVMPNRNGREVYEAIKKITPDIKVLFTSGYPAEHINDMIAKGSEFILKPVSPTKLLRKIREVIEK
ncbi:MAG: PAS domain S-box protein [Thermodesulfovibrionales bacterium]